MRRRRQRRPLQLGVLGRLDVRDGLGGGRLELGDQCRQGLLEDAVAGRLGVTDAARVTEFVRPTVKATLEDFVPNDAFTTPAKDAAPCDAETVAIDRVESAFGDLALSNLGADELEALKLLDDANGPSGDDPARCLFGA